MESVTCRVEGNGCDALVGNVNQIYMIYPNMTQPQHKIQKI